MCIPADHALSIYLFHPQYGAPTGYGSQQQHPGKAQYPPTQQPLPSPTYVGPPQQGMRPNGPTPPYSNGQNIYMGPNQFSNRQPQPPGFPNQFPNQQNFQVGFTSYGFELLPLSSQFINWILFYTIKNFYVKSLNKLYKDKEYMKKTNWIFKKKFLC